METQLCDAAHTGERGIGSRCRVGYSFKLLTGAGIDVGYGNAGEDCWAPQEILAVRGFD